jgi:ABC-type thiamin/hydroxymethylpyrimidine transport system permease subunit
MLVALLTKFRGSATLAGLLKGSIELLLPNHLGPLILLISLFEGLVVDLAFLPTKTYDKKYILFASGLSAVSNVFVLQVFQILPAALPAWIFLGMYAVSYTSGLVLGGYIVLLILSRLHFSI